jgi:hypothetical protein
MITYMLITTFVTIVVGILAHATKRAPIGFENDAGFHFERRLALMRLEKEAAAASRTYTGPMRRASDVGQSPR